MNQMSNADVAKLISIAIIFAGSLICGLLPFYRPFSTVSPCVLSLISCFGSGVLIATSLIHILAEAGDTCDIWGFTPKISFCVGILLLYLLEELVHFCVRHDSHSPTNHHEKDGHNHGVHKHREELANRCEHPATRTLLDNDSIEMSRLCENGRGRHQHRGREEPSDKPLPSSPQSERGNSFAGVSVHKELERFYSCYDLHSPADHHESDGHNLGAHMHQEEPRNRCQEPVATPLLGNDSIEMPRLRLYGHGQPRHGGGEEPPDELRMNEAGNSTGKEKEKAVKWRAFVGLQALSYQAALEGLPVGLGKQASDVWYICGAIAAYKFVSAFRLGLDVRNTSSSQCTKVRISSFKFRYVLSLALPTALGILMGLVITLLANEYSQPESSLCVPVILQSIAGGAFLYIAFFEVIFRERARYGISHGIGLLQLAAVAIGFIAMAVIKGFIFFEYDGYYPPGGYYYLNRNNDTLRLPIEN